MGKLLGLHGAGGAANFSLSPCTVGGSYTSRKEYSSGSVSRPPGRAALIPPNTRYLLHHREYSFLRSSSHDSMAPQMRRMAVFVRLGLVAFRGGSRRPVLRGSLPLMGVVRPAVLPRHQLGFPRPFPDGRLSWGCIPSLYLPSPRYKATGRLWVSFRSSLWDLCLTICSMGSGLWWIQVACCRSLRVRGVVAGRPGSGGGIFGETVIAGNSDLPQF